MIQQEQQQQQQEEEEEEGENVESITYGEFGIRFSSSNGVSRSRPGRRLATPDTGRRRRVVLVWIESPSYNATSQQGPILWRCRDFGTLYMTARTGQLKPIAKSRCKH